MVLFKNSQNNLWPILVRVCVVIFGILTTLSRSADVSLIFTNADGTQTEPFLLPRNALLWSKTLKNEIEMNEQLNVKDPITFNSISQETFLCLQDLITQEIIGKEEKFVFIDPTVSVNELIMRFTANSAIYNNKISLNAVIVRLKKNLSVVIENDDTYKSLNRRDLYLAGCYLDVHDKIKSALAALYVETMSDTNLSLISLSSDGNIPMFDGIPTNAHPLVAGWLLYKIINDKKMLPTFKSKDVALNGKIDVGPIISKS